MSAAGLASGHGSTGRPAARYSASNQTQRYGRGRRADRSRRSRSASSKIGFLKVVAFDAVVAGQAWHWVDPVLGAGKAAQVLRPHGLLALYWHVFDPPGEVADAFDARPCSAWRPTLRCESPSGSSTGNRPSNFNTQMLIRAADSVRTAGGFGEPEQWRFEWQRHYTRDEWLDHHAHHRHCLPSSCAGPAGIRAGSRAEQPSTRSEAAAPMHYVTLAAAAIRRRRRCTPAREAGRIHRAVHRCSACPHRARQYGHGAPGDLRRRQPQAGIGALADSHVAVRRTCSAVGCRHAAVVPQSRRSACTTPTIDGR